MKSTFRGYYPPTDAELEKIWTDGLIVLDANALLNILRYSAATRDQLLELLTKEKARIWIPHQVGLEFHRNRRKMPGELTKAFASVDAALTSARSNIEHELRNLGRHAHVEADELATSLSTHAEKLSKKLKRARKKHGKDVTSEQAHSETFNKISDLYDGRVGKPYDDSDLKAIYKEGESRYAKKIPPGFADAKTKDGDDKYGDLVLWRQILAHATEEKLPMLFITDDNKEDWWERAAGKTIGPRPELVEEYHAASGEPIHFYNLRRFLSYAKERGEDISDESVEEARKVSTVGDFKGHAARRERERRLGLSRLTADFELSPNTRLMLQQIAESAGPESVRITEAMRQIAELGIDPSTFASSVRPSEFWLNQARHDMFRRHLARDQSEAEQAFRRLNSQQEPLFEAEEPRGENELDLDSD